MIGLTWNDRSASHGISDRLRRNAQEQRKAKEAAKAEAIKKQFSAWDGSHYNLERYIKNSMHNPDSYEHVETKYIDKDTYIVVITKFRGTNAFGAVVTNSMAAEVGLDGSVRSIIQ